MKSGILGGGFYTAGLYAVGSLEYFFSVFGGSMFFCILRNKTHDVTDSGQ